MRLSTVVMGVGVGAFALVGCGGDGTGGLPAATAKISKEDSGKLKQLGEDLIKGDTGSSVLGGKLGKALSSEQMEYFDIAPEGKRDCGVSGTVEATYSKGHYADRFNEKGDVAYKKVSKDCLNNAEGYSTTGAINKGGTWEKSGDKVTWTWEQSIDSKFVSKKDEKNIFTITSSTKTKNGYWYMTHREGGKNAKVTSNAEVLINGKKSTYTNLTYSTQRKWKDEDNTDKIDVSAAIDSEVFGGVLVIKTEKAFVITSVNHTDYKCMEGKMEIKGKDHTVTLSCDNGKKKVEFDGKEVNIEIKK